MKTLEHQGIVKSISGRDIEVEICRSSACGSCEANGFCGVEREQQMISVKNVTRQVKVGDTVVVLMQESLGMQAVVLAYVIPLIIFFFSVVILNKLIHHEGIAGILALVFFAFYYIILRLFRSHLSRSFVFYLKSD